jgi:hypothetical protein
VTSVDPGAIEITGEGRRIPGLWGMGGEAFGVLRVAVKGPKDHLSVLDLSEMNSDEVIVAGAYAELEALQKAAEVGVKGVIVGGADHKDLSILAKQDLAVAITGKEKSPYSIILTGGFGPAAMDSDLIAFLKDFQGRWVFMDASTQIRAGVTRPEVIIGEKA